MKRGRSCLTPYPDPRNLSQASDPMVTAILLVTMMLPSTAPASTRATLEWDFSASRHVDLVPWPPGDRPTPDPFHHITVNQTVRVTVGPGKSFQRHVERVTFSRWGDRLSYVALNLEAQNAADAYTTGVELAEQWGLPRQRLDDWYAGVRAGKYEAVLAARRDVSPSVEVEMFRTFDDAQPFRLIFRFGWTTEHVRQEENRKETGGNK